MAPDDPAAGAASVLFVNHVSAPGGAETSLAILLGALDRARYRPILAAPPGPLTERAQALGVEVRPLALGRVRRSGGRADRAVGAARLARAAADLVAAADGVELIHANSATAALAAVPSAALRGLPLWWHVRDLRLPPGLVRLLSPWVDRAVAISSAVADMLEREGLPPERILRLPNALDPETFRPSRSRAEVRAELGLPPEAVVAIAVGQLVPWKGHALLLGTAARLINGSLPGGHRAELHWLIVGDDTFGEHAEYVAALRATAVRPPLAGRVVLAGRRDDVADLMAAADLLVLPSHGEPFGRVLLEAMAVGLPIVATEGGPGDVVVPEQTGLLVPPADAEALGAAIARLAADAAGRAAMGAAGRALLARQFSPAAQARTLMAAYDQALATRGSRVR